MLNISQRSLDILGNNITPRQCLKLGRLYTTCLCELNQTGKCRIRGNAFTVSLVNVVGVISQKQKDHLIYRYENMYNVKREPEVEIQVS
jgi:hypothetical protein